MFSGSIYKRCKCTEPRVDATGEPVLDSNGNPKTRELGTNCPDLKKRDHGSWYYYVNLPDGPRGERRRPRKGGFATRAAAQHAAQKLWTQANQGIDVESRETVEQFLRRWLSNRVDLKRKTRCDYADFLERIYIPALGHLTMRELRTRHIQAMFEDIWAYNKIKEANRKEAEEALAACEAARQAWRQAARPRPPELRQHWNEAKAILKEARAKPRQNTGPGTQKRFLDALSAALRAAVMEKLIAENWADEVVIPKYEKPRPLVWTDERIARWRQTGDKPSSVMVWTPELTGQFLDATAGHRMYVMWHLQVFRGPRRGEATGLTWAEVNMTQGTANIVQQLVSDTSHQLFEETPKSRSGRRTIALDSGTHQLLATWRDLQKAKRAEWEERHRKNPEKYGPYVDSGYVFTQDNGTPWHPDNVSKVFDRLLRSLDMPPIRLHDLRHCAASLSLAAGLSMKAIQALLGHATFTLTADTYASLMPQFEREAADAPVALVPRAQGQLVEEAATAEVDNARPELTLVKESGSPEAGKTAA
ncbi:tyrosine-type recombinase/integrase [Streptomyces violascens]|uniref:Site-specific integrase n=1 Tax=Streptomyces violascens TaxID=67381 RepID=A0ABQ3QUW3_9ACTN|nr:site-specific integrase [Streptomyces violascens]GHI41073.1 site-specific integrase [Streptomyces violascens]